jgi:histidine kinase/DNA gyrase B/HSP90-like ATPase
MSDRRSYEMIPSAKRLIKSLRDMGYDFPAAVADLIDNSIEAGASRVAIDIRFEGDNSRVRIADNGRGMDAEQLREAMRYGSERDYDEDALGKFGLGLKTASMSQCRRLSVASRSSMDGSDIAAYCWDLDHIEQKNKWEILALEHDGVGPFAREPLKNQPGTVVVWQKLDRILGYEHPYGDAARNRLLQMSRDVEEHLAMVFHRFLTGEVKNKQLQILLNGNEVKPWDPFCRNEQSTKALEPLRLAVEFEGALGEIRLEPFVLPHEDDFSSPDAFRRASGPSKWNQQQGFYIYRNGRMIQSGGWCRLRTADEHTKLARIGLSFSPVLDEAFKINVAKMRVQLPTYARDDLERALAPVVRLARESYDRKNRGRGPSAPPSEGKRTDETGRRPGSREGNGGDSGDTRFTLDQLTKLLMKFASDAERPVVKAVMQRLRDTLSGNRL